MAKQKEREDSRRQIVPNAEDPALVEFLESQFDLKPRTTEPGTPNAEPDVFADKIALRIATGAAGAELGPIVFSQEWKPLSAPAPTKEALVRLANTIVTKARQDAQALGRTSVYAVLAYSSAKGANAIARYLMRIVPGPKEYTETDQIPVEDDAESGTNMKGLLKELYRDRRFVQEHLGRMFQLHAAATESLISKYEQRLSATEAANQKLIETQLEMVKLREELLDRRAERARLDRMAAIKEEGIRKGIEVLGQMFPVVAGYLAAGKGQGVQGGVQVALQKFIAELPRDTLFALLGAYDEQGVQLRAGILTREQAEIILQVVDGAAPSSRLAELASSMNADQVMRAQQVLTPDQVQTLMAIFAAATSGAQPSTSTNGVRASS